MTVGDTMSSCYDPEARKRIEDTMRRSRVVSRMEQIVVEIEEATDARERSRLRQEYGLLCAALTSALGNGKG